LTEIHNRNLVPPTVGDYLPFYNVDVNTCRLYVPKDSQEAYRAADVWTEFTNIIEESGSDITPVNQPSLQLFPNPASDFVNLSGLQVNETIRLFDLNGRLFISRKAASESETVPVSHLPAGLYVVRIGNGQTVKLVKQ
jgi:hypothetical protein